MQQQFRFSFIGAIYGYLFVAKSIFAFNEKIFIFNENYLTFNEIYLYSTIKCIGI